MNPVRVYGLVTLSTFFWGANFVLAGPVLHDLPPLWAAALRFALGAAIMLALSTWRREPLLHPARAHAGAFMLLGAVGILGFNLLFFFAMESTSPANGALIMATNPLVTTLLASVVLGERPTARQWIALPLAFVGVLVVISGGNVRHLATLQFALGDLLMIGANVSWALYNVLNRRYLPAGSALTNTTLVLIAGAVLLLIVAPASGETLSLPGAKASLALIGMAVGGTVLAYLFWMTGIVRLGASRTALFLNLVPVFAMLLGALIGVAPTHVQVIGAVLVLGSVTLAMLPTRTAKAGEASAAFVCAPKARAAR
jgi:drug/metabolite transporter (DMT)-like permease